MSSPSPERRSSELTDTTATVCLSEIPESAARQEDLERVLSSEPSVREQSHAKDGNVDNVFIGHNKKLPFTPGEAEDYAVEFDGPDDPTRPVNWSSFKRSYHLLILFYSVLPVTFGSAAYVATVEHVGKEFHLGNVPTLLGVSLYVVGFAAGPVMWGPLSEHYGRRMPLLVSAFAFTCFCFLAGSAKDTQTLMISRFFQGFMGSSAFAVVPGAITDVTPPLYRGSALTFFMNIVLTGPVISPIVGGFVSYSYLGWRWTQYLCGIMGGFSLVVIYFFFEETYLSSILVHKARRLRKTTGNWAVHAVAEQHEVDFGTLLWVSIKRPLTLLVTEPIIFFCSLYAAFTYGVLYLSLTGFSIIFQERYHFSPTISQLPYIGMFIGIVIGNIYLSLCEIKIRRMTLAGKRVAPEFKLYMMIGPGFALPIGVFLTFWAGNYGPRVHWIAPVIGEAFIGFAIIGIFVCLTTYTVEYFLAVAASATAANAFLRAAFACATPLFTDAMFNNMGIQWAGTLIGCVAVALSLMPIVFVVFADKLKNSRKH